MITIEAEAKAAAPVSKARGAEPLDRSRHKLLEEIALGFALVWDGRVPARDKWAALALAIAICACVIAVQIPIEALIIMIFWKPAFMGAMAFDTAEALVGPVIFFCLLLPSLATASLVDEIRRARWS